MAYNIVNSKSSSCALALLLLLAMLSCFNQLALASRSNNIVHHAIAKSNNNINNEKVDKECLDHEGTVLIPGVGRYMVGSHERPEIRGLDHSIPAAVNGHYLPGADDTFVPNPGYEVPNPFRPGGRVP